MFQACVLQADTAARRRSLERAFGPMLAGGAHPGLQYLLTHKLPLVRSYPATAHAPLLLIQLLVAADAAAVLLPEACAWQSAQRLSLPTSTRRE